ncbi:MAG: tail fiber domain-containing protein [Lentimicrobium sp.]
MIIRSTFNKILILSTSLFLITPVVKVNGQGVMISNDPAAPEPSALLQTYGPATGDGNVLFTGEWKGAPGPVPALNAGTRMMWYPDKAAFRVGRVLGTQWNAENIGDYSAATGYNTTASGSYSNAWGSVTSASRSQATAWGFNTIASGTSATAWGENTRAPSFAETAFGYNNTSYIPVSSTEWVATDRLFVIGNGISGNSDALVLLKNGNLGLGTSSPTQRLEVTGSIYGQSSNWAIRGLKTGSGTFPGVWGETESTSANANGIRGFVLSTTSGSGSAGVFGKNFGTATTNYGVLGESVSASGRGVYGLASATTGANAGVYGHTASSDGYAGYFTGPQGSSNYFQREVGIGTDSPGRMLHVVGSASSSTPVMGIYTDYTGDQDVLGLQIYSQPSDGQGSGIDVIAGRSGVYSRALNNTTGTNPTFGVYGWASGGTAAFGIYGRAIGSNSSDLAGYFVGDVTVTGDFSNPSDNNLKKNIRQLDTSLERILKLDAKIYENKTDEYEFMNLAKGPQFGFIAQELETVFPELVKVNHHPGPIRAEQEEGIFYEPVDYKSINYIGMIPLLVKAIQEQQDLINKQQQEIDQLKKLIK